MCVGLSSHRDGCRWGAHESFAREVVAFRRPLARMRSPAGLHGISERPGCGRQVRAPVWRRKSGAKHTMPGRQPRRFDAGGQTPCATAPSGLRRFLRRAGRTMVRRRHSLIRLSPAAARPEPGRRAGDPLLAESPGFQSISPGNRFEFDADRIHDRNHGSSLEDKSRKG